VLTTVCYAMTLARTAPAQIPARIRLPTNAVWATVVFALNIFAFIFIGLQVRPIVAGLSAADLGRYMLIAVAVLLTVVVVRMAWHMSFNSIVRWRHRRMGFHPPRPMLRPTLGSGLVISWAGMRGIVTLAAALALPGGFPQRDLILLAAFTVVLGTLVLQGLTLKTLLRALALRDDDPVGAELQAAREGAMSAVLASLPSGTSDAVQLVRKEFKVRLKGGGYPVRTEAGAAYASAYADALRSARAALLAMRDRGDIGDDAFHAVENELDWMEVADPLRGANAD